MGTPKRLGAWFEAPEMEISYQPGDQALDVALTLCDDIFDQVIRRFVRVRSCVALA